MCKLRVMFRDIRGRPAATSLSLHDNNKCLYTLALHCCHDMTTVIVVIIDDVTELLRMHLQVQEIMRYAVRLHSCLAHTRRPPMMITSCAMDFCGDGRHLGLREFLQLFMVVKHLHLKYAYFELLSPAQRQRTSN